jgi:hypothetical protein
VLRDFEILLEDAGDGNIVIFFFVFVYNFKLCDSELNSSSDIPVGGGWQNRSLPYM